MSDKLIQIADDFWNIRGSFRIFGFIDIGTQASLVQLRSGGYVLLDSYTLTGDVKRQVMDITDDGTAVEAIINLHPFHTLHCANMHSDFPDAKLYGTGRHAERDPDLPWEELLTEQPEFRQLYPEDFEFSVPRGVEFVTDNEHVHFSSVLAFHRSSRTIHADDTLMYMRIPRPAVSFHPTLSQALEKRPGAAADFRDWATELATEWRDAENLCAAHTGALTKDRLRGETIEARIMAALERVSRKLDSHESRYG